MKHYNGYGWLLLTFLLLTSLSARIQPKPRPMPKESPLLFFKASRSDLTIYLFGTINGAFKPEIGYPLPERIFTALNESDLYISNQVDAENNPLLEEMTFTRASWEELLGDEEAHNLTQIVESLPIEESVKNSLLSYHPWLVLQILYYSTISDLGFNATPEEEILLYHASQNNIQSLSLDLLPLEANFIHLTSEHYAKELYHWIKMHFIFLQSGFNLAESLQNAWLQGDVMTILDQLVISRTPQFDNLHTEELQLYESLNLSIWHSIQQATEDREMTLFIALSADYLLDEGGFASFLEENDFHITRA